jgi:hypothetical protein
MSDFTIRLGPEEEEVGPLANVLYEFLRKLAPMFMSTFAELPARDGGHKPPIWTFQVSE